MFFIRLIVPHIIMIAQHFVKFNIQELDFQLHFLDRAIGAVVHHVRTKHLIHPGLQILYQGLVYGSSPHHQIGNSISFTFAFYCLGNS